MGSFQAPLFIAMTQELLTPFRLGALDLRNRVVMAPLTRCRCDNPDYVPTRCRA